MASLLFSSGLVVLKRATLSGANPMTVAFVANLSGVLVFSGFWLLPSEAIPWPLIWQPALVGLFYVLGQLGTFSAIHHGDVSIAAPMLGIKVLLVAVFSTLIGGQSLSIAIWLASLLATGGIALVQWTGTGRHKRVLYTIASALFASLSFSIFDVLVQRFCASNPAWSSNTFLPLMFAFVGGYSLVFLRSFQRELFADVAVKRSLMIGGMLIASQALCIVFALSVFGDAARVNVVYSMRGVWGVLIAWGVAVRWGGGEADAGRRTMSIRLGGALLITASVVIAILSG